ncbi:hypothetical protein AB1Y20_018675 [Prymnesium parvum]|uniref:Uncharacterized protein n=1 Tax=Prymnesium parvum TaxID=97485 RepID=A0AB34JS45_PRYPA
MPGSLETAREGGSSAASAGRVGRKSVCACGLCVEAVSFASSFETETPADEVRRSEACSAARSSAHAAEPTARRAAHAASAAAARLSPAAARRGTGAAAGWGEG